MKPRPMRFSESWKIGRFGVAENFFRRVTLIGGARNRGIGGVNQSAQQRLVAHDLDVVLNARTVGNAIHQADM